MSFTSEEMKIIKTALKHYIDNTEYDIRYYTESSIQDITNSIEKVYNKVSERLKEDSN